MPGTDCFQTHINQWILSGALWWGHLWSPCFRDMGAEAQRGWHVQGHTASRGWDWDGFNCLEDFLTRARTPWQVLATGIANCLGNADDIKRPGQGNVLHLVQGRKAQAMSQSLSQLPTKILPFSHQRAQRLNVNWKNLSSHFGTNFCIKSLVYFYDMQIRGIDGKFNNVIILAMP